jgi:uncharacterized protein YndB with AHSA1/START domain
MSTMTETARTADTHAGVQIYRVYIRATPQAIWDAITKPEWTTRYGYTGYVDYDLRPGGHYKVRATEAFRAASEAQGNELPEVIIDGEVVESDPPRRLVTTFRMLMDETMARDGFTTITHEIEPLDDEVTQLTLIHDCTGAPHLGALVAGKLGAQAGGGHAWILSDLKSLLETGEPMARYPTTA